MSSLDSGIGSLDMSSACSDEFAVRRLFVFIKDNLIFESLQDGLMQNKLLNEKEKEDYVCSNWTRHYWSERLLKLIIKKKKCKEFVAFMHQMSCHKHVSEKILEFHEKATEETQKAANGDVRKRPLILTYELLRRHFACLYMELEPREIADEMFQTGHISVSEHDNVTESNQRYKRLRCLLVILRKKDLYAAFVCILQSLKYITVLDTLQKDRKLKNKPSDYSTCIQHNFILLQEDLPGSYDATLFMEHVLSPTNISDIDSCKGAVRKRSKLLKILLIKGKSACKEFFRLLEVDLKREDLIQEMKNKSAKIKSRGRPSLNLRHRRLNISCLQEHEDFLNEELEPLDIGDLLFEERAMEISAHDKITETKKRQKQVKYLLETLKENENDCFYFFLYILQREDFESVLEELTKPAQGALGAVSSKQMEWRLLHRVEKEPDDVKNEDIQMRLTVGGRTGHQVEQAFQDGYSSGTGILEEAILHGAVDIRNVSSGSVVLQLRPLTDQAVQTLLNVRDNNRLVEMIVGMLKKVNIASLMDGTEPLEIKVQVYKANPVDAISKTDDAELIKMRLKAHKNVLFSELEPRALAYVLSKSKAFDKGAIDSVLNADSCNDRVGILLSLVENGDSEVVKEFVTALKDLGYSSIVELIDPPDIHNKAENIRKIIISNYKNILEEMQIKLARETLSKCVGKVDEITEKISPKFGNRKQRMSNFLQFILQDDHNVIEFEKILRNNDLEDLLNIDENVQGEHIPTQGIEMTFVEDRIHSSSERVLFESVITLSHTEILHGHGIDISETQDQILDILSKNRSQDTRNDNDESQRSGNRASAQCNKDVKETVKNMTPGAPFLVSEKSDRMTMQWNSIGDLNSDFEYQIQYKEVPDGQWIIHESAVSSDSSRAVITGLKSRTSYCFINSREGKEYPFSSETKKFDKPESPGLQMRYRSTVVKLGNPEIYRLPTKENIAARNETVKFKKFSLGSERLGINDKTIMLVGATGSGKSTLIDGFANYLFGVNWEDDFRFTLVDLEHEEKGRFKDQAVSQTEWITCYSIYPDIDVTTKLEYALHIVDTPGFGDTRGIEQDKKIMKQIEKMFTLPGDKGMACLDAVCFLVKAPDARLTTSQKYIMDAILSLFGKDMEDNICICITFAEAQEPPVLASLAKSRLPHKYYFKFNNSALFACNENRDNLASGFWKIGMESFDSFFERLDLMETKSLQLTKEVLKTRQDLENTVHNLQSWITAGIGKISALEEEKSIFKKYKKQIEENKDFVYEVTEQLMEKEDISGKGQHTTNCLTCNYTCHEKCSIPEDLQKSHCIAMDEHGNCKQCPGNCQWQLHHNTPYIIRWVSKKVKKNYREKLKLYTTAKEQVSSRTEVLQKMTKSVEDIEIVIAQLLDKITECNNWLKKKALKENPMNTADFIELMIESEKRERKPGYMLRIKVLEDCRRKAMIGIEATDFLYKAGQTRRGAMSINVPTSGSLISSMRSLMRL